MPPVRPIQSILAATDLTDEAKAALRAARVLRGGVDDIRLHVAHCRQRGEVADPDGEGSSYHARHLALEHLEEAGIDPADAAIHLPQGAPHRELPRLADELDVDLIVLGAHRPRSTFDGLLGSTADRVLRLARRPCLVVNRDLQALPRRIIVASDLSPISARALDFAVTWADQWAARGVNGTVHLELLHVFDFGRPGYSPKESHPEKLHREAERAAEGAMGSRVSLRPRTLSAPLATEGIRRVVEENHPDLLVLGTHGHGFFLRTLLGSAASEVVRTMPEPIVVVPPAPDTREPGNA